MVDTGKGEDFQMTRCKKLLGAMLSILMVFALTPVMAFAASGTNNDDGTITIENATEGEEYSVYQILELESYNTEAEAYSYKAANDWAHFLGSDAVQGKYMTQQNGYFSWVEGASVPDFAKLAIEYAKSEGSGIEPTRGPVKADGNTVEFKGLSLGYYLLDSSMGTLCSLDTTDPEVKINEKNDEPFIDKKVQEDSLMGSENPESSWGSDNTASIGETVNFKSTITARKGAKNYVFHDTMTNLTFDASSIKVKIDKANDEADPTEVNIDKYTVLINGQPGNAPEDETCTFEIKFHKDFCDTLEDGDSIIIEYSAILNENAIIQEDGNPNVCKLTYGKNSSTTESKTTTYTSGFDLIKIKAGDDRNDETIQSPLFGAAFRIYEKDSGTPILFFLSAPNTYTVAAPNHVGETITEIPAGVAYINGLDIGRYSLEEASTPDGYNSLPDKVDFEVTRDFTRFADKDKDGNPYGQWIENNTGLLLPYTGGIGTTIFYIIGSLLVVGAIVFIITRKRRSNTEK